MRILQSLLTLISLLLLTASYGQDDGNNKVDMADAMRSNGRIYVVVTVVIVILIGLLLYLVRLDRKITKMEKERS
jgi:CcmD family protein